MNSDKKEIAIKIVILLIACVLGSGLFLLNREFNFKFGYEKMVIKTIKKNVKPECLIAP